MHITELMKIGVDKNASDIFLTVGVPPVFKIDSGFEYYGDKILMKNDTEEMIKQLFQDDQKYETFLKKGEMDFSFSSPGVGRFRVDVYIQRNSHAAAIRVLKFDILDTSKLRIPQEVLDVRNINKGLVLVTGPTGSGKSTTLACIIDMINSERETHILTLEDPIEFIHKHKKSIVNQREIGIDTASYQEGLRASMRQSPDVILIGEMRDYETMSIAMTAAETGHLVLSTLHTVGGAKTVDRVIDVFPSNQQDQIRIQLSTILRAVVSQQLIPKIGGGRVPAFEIMIVTHAIRNLIREGKIPQIEAAIHSGRSEGMISMDYSIAQLLKEGVITKDDALHYCINPDTLQRYINAR